MQVNWYDSRASTPPGSASIPRGLFIACMLTLILAGLAGCNTTRGVGQDVQAAGDAIEETAEEAEEELED